MKKVAVVILNWNGKKLLDRFLPSVVKNSNSDLATIYVADNASSDDSVDFLKKNYPEIKIISLDKNYGFAGGYNRALENLDEEFFVLLNSDVEVSNNWIEPIVKQMDADSNLAAAQPKIISFRNKNFFEYAGASGGFIDYLGYPFCRGRILSEVEMDKGQYDSPIDVFWCTGTSLFVRSEIYKKTGGLDNRFFAHMEEIDFCWRLNALGYRLICEPQSTVYHYGGATLDYSNPHKLYLNFRNSLLMLYKNLPENKIKSIMFKRLVLDGVAAFQFAAKMEFKSVKAIWMAHKSFYAMRKDYKTVRKDIQQKVIKTKHNTMLNKSLIFLYYFGRKHLFSKIVGHFDTKL